MVGVVLLKRAALGRVLDIPEARSVHVKPTPRIGGTLVILASIFALVVSAYVLPARGSWQSCALAVGLPALLLFACGLVDDITRLRARTKGIILIGIAAGAVYGLGWRWHGVALAPWPDLSLGAATQPMTVLWIVACVILMNFVDGIDHLCSMTGGVLVVVGSASAPGTVLGLVYAAFGGALIGFTAWNVHPARMFLGDSGSQVVGFLVATVPLMSNRIHGSSDASLTPWVVPAGALLPIVIDVGMALIGKWRRSIPLAKAHSDHLYQHLTKIGHAHASVALSYAGLAVFAVFEIAWIAPRMGLGVCLATSALVLALFFGSGWWRTRSVPWGHGARVTPAAWPRR